MNEHQMGPDLIDKIAQGHQAAHVLLAANRLGIFKALGHESKTSDELAQTLGTDRRATRILCNALTALELLEKQDGAYKNSVHALNSLLPDSPKPKSAMLLHQARLAATWSQLYDVVLEGKPVPPDRIDPRLIGDERQFANAMADVGRLSAVQTADEIDLSNAKSMLDIGGGPGLYSIEFVKRYPELRATIADDEKTLEIAKENIEKSGLSERISIQPGNVLTDDLGNDYNFILISNVIHIFSKDTNRQLVAKSADALASGGLLCVKDFLLEPDRTKPAWNALFAVNMLVNTGEGDCHTLEEVKEWFKDAGLTFDRVMEITPQSILAIAKKA